jgi:hypothetical protein
MQSNRDVEMIHTFPNAILSRISSLNLNGQRHGCNPETAVLTYLLTYSFTELSPS